MNESKSQRIFNSELMDCKSTFDFFKYLSSNLFAARKENLLYQGGKTFLRQKYLFSSNIKRNENY